MPFTIKKIAMRLRNDSEYIPLPGVRGEAGPGVPAGGSTGQVLAKASNADNDTEWVNQSGGGGTSDYTDLTNKPSINNVTLSGNKTAAQLGLATPSDIPTVPVQSVNGKTGAVELSASDVSALPLAGGTMSGNIDMNGNKVTKLPSPTNYQDAANKDYVDKRYLKPSTGIPQTDLAQTVQNKLDNTVVISDTQPTASENKLWVDTDAGTGTSYQVPTVAEMEAADAQVAADIGIVITGKRPSMAVTAGQYVIVRGSTISGITDGLYTANAALSPSTDVTAANLMAVSNGGLNSLSALIDSKHIPVWPTLTKYNSVQDVVNVMSGLPTNSVLLNTFGNTLRTDLFDTASSYDGFIVCFKASGNNIYYLAYSRDVAAIGNINIPNVSVTYKHSLL